jgi:hypothetical protein
MKWLRTSGERKARARRGRKSQFVFPPAVEDVDPLAPSRLPLLLTLNPTTYAPGLLLVAQFRFNRSFILN